MAELKTKKNRGSVTAFLNAVEDNQRRADSKKIAKLMREVTGERASMWGESIVGYGSYHYKYASGREGETFVAGFSPRKQALTLYIMAGFSRYDDMLAKLGKFKHGKSCLYIKKLTDVDMDVLRELVAASVKHVRAMDKRAKKES